MVLSPFGRALTSAGASDRARLVQVRRKAARWRSDERDGRIGETQDPPEQADGLEGS